MELESTEKTNQTTMENQNKIIIDNQMGVMPVGRLILKMSWPAMLSMFLQGLYNIIDSMFVATISEDALTAVTLAFPIQMLLIAVSVGTGIGVNSLISRRLGARKQEEADSAASHGFRLSFINWFVFAIFGLLFSGTYMMVYSHTQYIIQSGTIYLQVVTIGSIFLFILVNTEKVLQSTGNMIIPMICSLLGVITNAIFDAILIFGLFGFPKLGVLGAAIATVFGQFLSMLLGLILLFGKNHLVNIQIRNFKWDSKIIKDIYSVGFPGMLMQSIMSVMLFCINGLLAAQTETAVAVLGAYFRLQSFFFMPVFGLNQGVLPIIGYNYGARNRHRVMEAYKKGILIAVVIMTIGTIIFQVIPDKLLMLFSASLQMLTIGVPALRIISICFIPAAFGILTSTFFQATGHGMHSLWQSLIRQLVGIVPLVWLLIKIGGIAIVWWAWPLAEIMGVIYCIIFMKSLYEKEIKLL